MLQKSNYVVKTRIYSYMFITVPKEYISSIDEERSLLPTRPSSGQSVRSPQRRKYSTFLENKGTMHSAGTRMAKVHQYCIEGVKSADASSATWGDGDVHRH